MPLTYGFARPRRSQDRGSTFGSVSSRRQSTPLKSHLCRSDPQFPANRRDEQRHLALTRRRRGPGTAESPGILCLCPQVLAGICAGHRAVTLNVEPASDVPDACPRAASPWVQAWLPSAVAAISAARMRTHVTWNSTMYWSAVGCAFSPCASLWRRFKDHGSTSAAWR